MTFRRSSTETRGPGLLRVYSVDPASDEKEQRWENPTQNKQYKTNNVGGKTNALGTAWNEPEGGCGAQAL